jgi:hypothetical protein
MEVAPEIQRVLVDPSRCRNTSEKDLVHATTTGDGARHF